MNWLSCVRFLQKSIPSTLVTDCPGGQSFRSCALRHFCQASWVCWVSASYLLHRAHGTNRFPPTECCPIWDLIRHKEDLPSQEIGTFIRYPSARKPGRKTWDTTNKKSNLLTKPTVTPLCATASRAVDFTNRQSHSSPWWRLRR